MEPDNALSDNTLWDYAVALYSRDECATLCLELQNDFGLSVNRLLFALWLAEHHRRYPALEVLDSAEQWQQSLLVPLRELRYRLRGLKHSVSEDACYSALKQTELLAERVELERLQQQLDECPPAEAEEKPRLDNLLSSLPATLSENKAIRQRLQQLAGIAAQYGSN